MATMSLYSRLHLLFFLACFVTSTAASDGRQPYIIHMDKSAIPSPFTTHETWYMSTLSSLSAKDGVSATLLYAYNHVIHGFSAVLSPSQLKELETTPGHLATYPESYGQLHTTHTSQFLGLKNHAGLWPAANFGNGAIIGIIDTGVWPESESFNDHGMPPVPERWKGMCEEGTEFNSSHCNRKLIGARSFSKGLKERGLNISKTDDYDSPRDFMGHGTHTSSTAAGNRVRGAEYFGYAEGTAVGIAPMAYVAMYKVLWATDTYESASSDVLAGMDQAIEDGVDLMSLSLGFIETKYYENVIALGAFAALEKGIFVYCSAGNNGPHAYTILNGAPWITTVGAGTIDRGLAGSVTLGDGVASFLGKSMFPERVYISRTPLYYGEGNSSKENCDDLSLDPEEVAGKVLFCSFNISDYRGDPLAEVNRTGAAGAIFVSDSPQFLRKTDFALPVIAISLKNGEIIKQYIKTTADPTVDLKFQITVVGQKPAPQVAWFSSRGPSRVSPGILKPDILAPGVDILAAWVPNRAAVPVGSDYLVTDYYLASGTSMASPHVVGIAALLKSVHPDWSPAAIRSSLMTTADIIDNTLGPIIDQTTASSGTPLDFGGGHINPSKAMDPGLIYDIELQDYIDFVCGLNYTSNQIAVITRRSNYSCTTVNLDLNYPSFIVIVDNMTASREFQRVLTNVGDSSSVYRAVVKAPTGMRIVVEPQTLTFSGKYSKQAFSVSVGVSLEVKPESDYIGSYGYLTWVEVGGKHEVRSPIVSAYAGRHI